MKFAMPGFAIHNSKFKCRIFECIFKYLHHLTSGFVLMFFMQIQCANRLGPVSMVEKMLIQNWQLFVRNVYIRHQVALVRPNEFVIKTGWWVNVANHKLVKGTHIKHKLKAWFGHCRCFSSIWNYITCINYIAGLFRSEIMDFVQVGWSKYLLCQLFF